ncbi:MAG: DUF2804 domain-containing protein [Treponema sp.]|nr:DUF2804 domain-containing protein [Treponema sp.]MCL2251027.1 DUF2804 domain-containing protein [Treponema sp.]
MYSREILSPIASPVKDGRPVFGTWNKAFEKADLLEIRKPYNYPFPRWLRDCRIKEWQCFTVQNDSYLLEALFCNIKLYQMVQVLLYDKKNKKKYLFIKKKSFSGWQLPQSLSNSIVESRSSNFFFQIHNWLDTNTVKLYLNIESTRKNPSLTVHLEYNVTQETTPMTVSLGFSERRSMYAFKTLTPVHGSMVFEENQIEFKQDTCSGFFCDYKGFFPYNMQTTMCNATSLNEEKEHFGFHLAENQTKETNKNNENALWVNGKLTLLPPVLITMPNGPESNWNIQDIEGMVDLTFSPIEQNKGVSNLLFTKADFIASVGTYNGMLVNSEGEKIKIKDLFGMGEKLFLRM